MASTGLAVKVGLVAGAREEGEAEVEGWEEADCVARENRVQQR